MKTKERGITLIALVVTIIVLLILAGISIQMLLGETGILRMAKEAKEKTKSSEEDEQRSLKKVEIYMDETKTEEEKQRELARIEATENKKNREYVDKNGEKLIIPGGFAPTEIEGENTVEEGFVMTDEEGNEFVWIPCNGKSGVTYEKVNGLATTWKNKYENNQFEYMQYLDWKDEGGNTNSVSIYGGFYIGRYEAGLPADNSLWEDRNGATYGWVNEESPEAVIKGNRDTTSLLPVSKKDNASWNQITQISAMKISSKMYENNEYVISSLVDSYAWDTMIEYIQKGKNKVDSVLNSTDYGNYINSSFTIENALYAEHVFHWKNDKDDTEIEKYKTFASKYIKGKLIVTSRTRQGDQTLYEIATGATDQTRVKNIYDIAGNMWEWTTEIGQHHTESDKSGTDNYAVFRGGSYWVYGKAPNSVCFRGGNNKETFKYTDVGFRIVLYIK